MGTPFDQAAARLTATLEGGAQLTDADYRLVSSTLVRFARGVGVSNTDAEEVVADVIAQTLERLRSKDAPEVRHPSGYLFWATRNRSRDRLRRLRVRNEAALTVDDRGFDPEHAATYYSRSDADIARMLDPDASVAILEDAMRAAHAAGDRLLIRVVTVWLNMADEQGKPPTSRELARRTDLSHTSVNQALRRLRNYFPPRDVPASIR